MRSLQVLKRKHKHELYQVDTVKEKREGLLQDDGRITIFKNKYLIWSHGYALIGCRFSGPKCPFY